VKASIRLASPLVPLVLILLSVLASGCAAGTTHAGASAPRLIREPMVLADDGASHSAGPAAQQARLPDGVHSAPLAWKLNATH